MSADLETIIVEVSKLKRRHYYCDDSWYSCPMAEDGCSDEREPKRCNCGADKENVSIDALIGRIRALFAETAQQPNNTGSPKLPDTAECIKHLEAGYDGFFINSSREKVLIERVLHFVECQLRAGA